MLCEALTGGCLLEISGEGNKEKADALAQKMREVLEPQGVKVARPAKSADLRIRGLDDSVTPEEVKSALARAGGCREDELRVGPIRRAPSGSGSAWAQGPLAAVKKITAARKVTVGWVAATVEALDPRPLRCYRCLQEGHVGQRCTETSSRGDRCYRCGDPSHKARDCGADPKCPLCVDLGRPANHRLGSKSCAPRPKKGAGTGAPTKGAAARGPKVAPTSTATQGGRQETPPTAQATAGDGGEGGPIEGPPTETERQEEAMQID